MQEKIQFCRTARKKVQCEGGRAISGPNEGEKNSTNRCFKIYREINKDSNTSVKLVKDKLLVGNQLIDNIFDRNRLQIVPTDTVPSISDVT